MPDLYAFGWPAPYPLLSLPKLLGTLGGVALLVGTAGLLWLNLKRHPEHGDVAQRPMDRGFVSLLFFIALTGLALPISAQSSALPITLCLHLGAVMAFFATLPYSKFAHGIYRCAALLKWAIEKRLPNPVTASE